MINIDGEDYYTLQDLKEKKLASKTTVYRLKRAGELKVYKSLNGAPLIKVSDIVKHLKKNSAA